MVRTLSSLPLADLVAAHSEAIAGQRAALVLCSASEGDHLVAADAHFETAAEVVRIFRTELQRRMLACSTQDELDRHNAVLRGRSLAEIQEERASA